MVFLSRDQFTALDVAPSGLPDLMTDDIVETIIRDLPGWDGTQKFSWDITSWKSNPLYSGGWETWEVGGTFSDYQAAIQPVQRLHKAGAAHCLNLYGFTYGAILSGLWQVEWIMNRLMNVPVADEVPYTPCEDSGRVTNREWRQFYDKFGSLFEAGLGS